MSALLERFAAKASEQRQTAVQRYREILARADKPKDGDEVRLGELMAELGLSQNDVQNDLYALHDAHRIEAETPTQESIEQRERDLADQTAKAHAGARDALAELVQRLDPMHFGAVYHQLLARTDTNLQPAYDQRVVAPLNAAALAQMELGNLEQDRARKLAKAEQIRAAHPRVFA